MYTLSDQQVDFILDDIRQHGIQIEDLQQNLLDHICILVEQNLEENGDFEQYYSSVISSFYRQEMREIEEETGVRVELGAALPASEYVDRHGRPKVVHYWRMTPIGAAAWVPGDEVDETRWITAAEAATLLSYEHDRRLVAAVEGVSHGGQA